MTAIVAMQTGGVTDNNTYRDQSAELATYLMQLSEAVLSTPAVMWALEVSRAVREGNGVAFFRLLQQATYIQSCLCHLLFFEVRAA